MNVLAVIAAPPAAGKTELGKALTAGWGFRHVVGSDVIKWKYQNLHPTEPPLEDRDRIKEFYAQWSREAGSGIIADTVLNMMREAGDAVRICYDGVRNRNDARKMEAAGGVIVALDCPLELRRKRFSERKGTEIPLDEYREIVRKENEPEKEDGLHLDEVMAMAEIRIDSSQPIEAVTRELIAALRGRGFDI